MSTKNRGDRIQLLQKVVTKYYTPVPPTEDRSVLEQLIYACCLEDVPYDSADEAFHRLQESFFDWNEVRVTTVSELCETLHNLPEPAAAALRIKKNLQSLFETRYSFDIDDMLKMNQGKAIAELEKLGGMTKFVLGYMTQNALGGHAIPVSNSILQVLLATEIVTPSEAEKGQVPGLERTVPKTKGNAFASCLHQLAIDFATSPTKKEIKAVMKEAGAVEPKKPVPGKADSSKVAESQTSAAGNNKSSAVTKKTASSGHAADKTSNAKTASSKKSTSKKPAASSAIAKSSSKTASKKPTTKPTTKSSGKAISKPTAQDTSSKKKSPPKKPTSKTSPKSSSKRKPR